MLLLFVVLETANLGLWCCIEREIYVWLAGYVEIEVIILDEDIVVSA